MERDFAIKELGLEVEKKNILYFGLIRDYKGLDILIDAFSMLDDSYQLIIAGEPYGSFDKYQTQIDLSPNRQRIKLFTRYISDSEVPKFFSASDVCVLPYRSATQSGISAISYHFELPMITTNVGGLKEAIEKPGTGIVVEANNPVAITNAISIFFNKEMKNTLQQNIIREKNKLSWSNFSDQLIDFYKTI
jgi:glycosyltransferase involved in cell wall biosynthesis